MISAFSFGVGCKFRIAVTWFTNCLIRIRCSVKNTKTEIKTPPNTGKSKPTSKAKTLEKHKNHVADEEKVTRGPSLKAQSELQVEAQVKVQKEELLSQLHSDRINRP